MLLVRRARCWCAPHHSAHAAVVPLRCSPRRSARAAARTVSLAAAMTGAPAAAGGASCCVAVVGGGAAGLAAARVLSQEGLQPVVFEQAPSAGGVWVYSDDVDASPLGSDDPTARAHSSMYAGLRTNLPREVMSFTELPFTPAAMAAAGVRSGDARRFPGHAEVLAYLRAYARHYGLERYVRFGARVVAAAPLWGGGGGQGQQAAAAARNGGHTSSSDGHAAGGEAAVSSSSSSGSSSRGPRWALTVEVAEGAGGSVRQERHEFDALLVCNGHYSATNLPQVEGAGAFPGVQLHSHNYRSPEPFVGQRVLVVGASNSGEDLCREIASVAERVYICARSWKNAAWGSDAAPFGPRANIERRGMVARLRADGGAEFEAGEAVGRLDAVVYATGYRYDFPFLRGAVVAPEDAGAAAAAGGGKAGSGGGSGLLSTAQQHVAPLWGHMYYPPLAPTLAFIGLPWKVVPFPQFELQARLAARALSGAAVLPDAASMQREAEGFYQRLAADGVPPRWTHMMGDAQWAYNDWLVEAAGCPPDAKLPAWRAAMYAATGASKRSHPEDYRDRWVDADSLAAAQQQLGQLEAALLSSGAATAAPAAS